MKSFKRNVLKAVIAGTCAVVPLNKLNAQTKEKTELKKETICEFGASYTPKTMGKIYSFGGYINLGQMIYAKKSESKLFSCGGVYGSVGTICFNTDTDKLRYLVGCGAKIGGGYGRVALVLYKEVGLSFGNKGNMIFTSSYGTSLYCTVAPYTKLFADIKWSVPVMAPTPASQEYAARQKIMLGIGLVHVFVSKEHAK